MSLRKQVLNEIKSLLNEASLSDMRIPSMLSYFKKLKPNEIEHAASPETAKDLLEAFYKVFSGTAAGTLSGMEVANAVDMWGKVQGFTKRAICKLGNESGKYSKPIKMPEGYPIISPESPGTITLCVEQGSPAPKPPKPPEPSAICPDGTPAPGGDKSKCKGGKGPRGPGCKPGSQFIGLNGITSGDQVRQLQVSLNSLLQISVESGSRRNARGFEFGGEFDEPGTFGRATEDAVKYFQTNYGKKYAAKIRSELGREMPLEKVDACVGPKTSCAILLAGGRPVLGYDRAKCIKAFGAKKIGQKRIGQADGEQEVPDTGKSEIAESKNWIDRTREGSSNSLFERLVKDISDKKTL